MCLHKNLLSPTFNDIEEEKNFNKYKFLDSRDEFSGHVVEKNSIHTNDCKIKAVKNFPIPKSVNDVRSFLGLTEYYRAFIKMFAFLASPLTCFL